MASSSKENILRKIRQALSHPVPLPFPKSEGNNSVFQPASEELEVHFAKEFTHLLGKFAFCMSQEDMVNQLQALIKIRNWKNIYCVEKGLMDIVSSSATFPINTSNLADCDASVTSCEYLIARTGSIVMSSAQQSGRTVSVYAPIHICIAYTDQLVYDIKESLQLLKEKYADNIPSMITFATGPSRTADIEKSLVVGVHGPKEAFVFLLDRPIAQD
jgi:L-lactate dehydrogenase complex protein LldG